MRRFHKFPLELLNYRATWQVVVNVRPLFDQPLLGRFRTDLFRLH